MSDVHNEAYCERVMVTRTQYVKNSQEMPKAVPRHSGQVVQVPTVILTIVSHVQ